MIVMSGLAGALVNASGLQNGIRGKFQAGRAFQATTMALFAPGSDSPSDTLELKLISFKHFTRPDRPRAEMVFTARLLGVNEMVTSEYVFQWGNTGILYTPGVEKSYLREMIEQSLAHWSNIFLVGYQSNPTHFPPPQSGNFQGNNVDCTFKAFISP